MKKMLYILFLAIISSIVAADVSMTTDPDPAVKGFSVTFQMDGTSYYAYAGVLDSTGSVVGPVNFSCRSLTCSGNSSGSFMVPKNRAAGNWSLQVFDYSKSQWINIPFDVVEAGICNDGTLWSTCSVNKPKFCVQGDLVNQCAVCGCPAGNTCQSDGSCSVPTSTGLLAHYPLDGNADDISGNNNHGTIVGDVTCNEKGVDKSACAFDGKGAMIQIPNVIDGLSAVTISAWFNYSDSSTWRWVYGGGPGWNFNPGLTVKAGSNVMRYHWRTTDKSFYTKDGYITVAPEKWHHIAYVYDGKSITSYVDGQLDFSQLTSGKIVAPLVQAIGAGYWDANEYFKGNIDDVRIYNEALSEAEIKKLYANGTTPSCGSEICGNNIDDDCDGQVDEGCISLCDIDGTLLEGKTGSYTIDGSEVKITVDSVVFDPYAIDGSFSSYTIMNYSGESSITLHVGESYTYVDSSSILIKDIIMPPYSNASVPKVAFCFNLNGENVCTDSDGGLDYYVKGTVLYYKSCSADTLPCSIADRCVDSDNLNEGFCDGLIGRADTYSCPNGCSYGACISSPSVKVIQPNGGEVLTDGDQYKITWSMQGIDYSSVSIGYKACPSCLEWISFDTPTDPSSAIQSYNWKVSVVPSRLGANLTLYVTGYDPKGDQWLEDTSDAPFIVVAGIDPYLIEHDIPPFIYQRSVLINDTELDLETNIGLEMHVAEYSSDRIAVVQVFENDVESSELLDALKSLASTYSVYQGTITVDGNQYQAITVTGDNDLGYFWSYGNYVVSAWSDAGDDAYPVEIMEAYMRKYPSDLGMESHCEDCGIGIFNICDETECHSLGNCLYKGVCEEVPSTLKEDLRSGMEKQFNTNELLTLLGAGAHVKLLVDINDKLTYVYDILKGTDTAKVYSDLSDDSEDVGVEYLHYSPYLKMMDNPSCNQVYADLDLQNIEITSFKFIEDGQFSCTSEFQREYCAALEACATPEMLQAMDCCGKTSATCSQTYQTHWDKLECSPLDCEPDLYVGCATRWLFGTQYSEICESDRYQTECTVYPECKPGYDKVNEMPCLPLEPVLDLAEYPNQFVSGNQFDGFLVVGDQAPAEHVIAVSAISVGLLNAGYQVPPARLASNVSDPFGQNIIAVGGACDNSITAALYNNPYDCTSIDPPAGYGKIQLMNQNGMYQIAVLGGNSNDIRNAGIVLGNFGDYALAGTEVCVTAIGSTLSVGSCPLPTTETITIKAVGSQQYNLEFTDADGNGPSLPIAYAVSDTDVHVGSQNHATVLRETEFIDKDDYFVLTDYQGSHSWALQYRDADSINDTDPQIRFKNLGDGSIIEKDLKPGNGTTLRMGGKDFTIYTLSSSDDPTLYIDLDGDGALRNGLIHIFTFSKSDISADYVAGNKISLIIQSAGPLDLKTPIGGYSSPGAQKFEFSIQAATGPILTMQEEVSCVVVDTLVEDDKTRDYVIGGKVYSIANVIVSDVLDKARFFVNGQLGKPLMDGEDDVVSDLKLSVEGIAVTPGQDLVKICLKQTNEPQQDIACSGILDTLSEGEIKVYDLNGVEYEVKLSYVADQNPMQVRFVVNGEDTGLIGAGDLLTLADGSTIRAHYIMPNAINDTPNSMADFCLERHDISTAHFEFKDSVNNTFIFELTNPPLIQEARDILNGIRTGKVHVSGTTLKGTVSYNPAWSYYLDPSSVQFFENSVEVCDASIQYVEDAFNTIGNSSLPNEWWCPWSSQLTREIVSGVCGNGITDLGEECDDGNLLDGDVCSHNCEIEGVNQCNDGIDNDGDGLIDWPDDLECDSITDEESDNLFPNDILIQNDISFMNYLESDFYDWVVDVIPDNSGVSYRANYENNFEVQAIVDLYSHSAGLAEAAIQNLQSLGYSESTLFGQTVYLIDDGRDYGAFWVHENKIVGAIGYESLNSFNPVDPQEPLTVIQSYLEKFPSELGSSSSVSISIATLKDTYAVGDPIRLTPAGDSQ